MNTPRTKKTAFLVVHGNLPNKPFEALDKFGGNFGKYLEKKFGKMNWHHEFYRHEDWIENYISIVTEDGAFQFDFYEYYWDIYMQNRVEFHEVLDWLIKASKGARNFYRRADMKGKAVDYCKQNISLFKDDEFLSGGYLVLLGRIGKILRPLAMDDNRIKSVFGMGLLAILIDMVMKQIKFLFNDVVIYTTTDVRSKRYNARKKILGGCVKKVTSLVEDSDYHQIVLAGHSLGSLILYDTLNRIIHDINANKRDSKPNTKKISGLVTFGSPLDKIAFFFRERAEEEQFVREQILDHFHCFKHISMDGNRSEITISDPVKERLEDTKWINFYHREDTFSGHLDAYRDVVNIDTQENVDGLINAHSHYWKCETMYREIANRLL